MTATTSAVCQDCERCRWQPDVDCGIAEHPHCARCGHCMGRHGAEIAYQPATVAQQEGAAIRP